MMSGPISTPQVPWQSTQLATQLEKAYKAAEGDGLTSKNDAKLRDACAEFESLFIFYLLKEMRATVPKSGFIGGGRAEEIYTSMLDSQLAKQVSAKGGIGLSTILLDQLGGKQKQIEDNRPE
jgi:flagellar protein FlgJ